MFTLASIAFLTLASSSLADPAPLTPATGNQGAPCIISWSPDTTGKWNNTSIELMTGENQHMEHVTTVVTGLDTTSAAATSYTWTCPDVTVNAAIYWYQLSHPEDPTDLLWTTRFAIANAAGATTTPEHATQPDGTAVPWGEGALTDMSQAKPAPAYITGETSVGAGNGTSSGSILSGTSISTSMIMTSTGMTMTTSSMPDTTSVSTSSTTSAPASTSPSKSGAGRTTSHDAIFALGAVVAGALLFA